jgi:protein O-GlcNAc transferase
MSNASVAATFQQGLALHQQGKLDEAEALYRSVLATEATHFGALHLTGLIHFQRGQPGAAVEWIGRAIAVNPGVPEAHSNLGLALHQMKQIDAAMISYDRALQLRPDSPEALNNRGNALQDLRRLPEALASYDRALIARPNFAQAHNNRGNALRGLGRLVEALASYDRALQLWPDFADALDNRGRILRDLERFDEAVPSFARLLAVSPARAYGQGLLLESRLRCCDWTDYDITASAIVSGIERGERIDAPFSFLNYSLSPQAQLRCAQMFTAAECPVAPAPLTTGRGGRHDRIRVAYLSSDFRTHAVAFLAAGLFESHDRARFEVTGVSFGPDDQGPMRRRMEGAFDRFVDVRDRNDRDVACLLHEHEIDIAVDLNGFTARNRMDIFAHRGAPVQVNYLGFPGTMGAPFIDYIVADRYVIPEGLEAAYSEKVVRLPDSYQVNDRKRSIAEHTPARVELGLPESGFVFCSFNNSFKITPATFDVWMGLLRQVEGSVLWLLGDNAAAMANLRREAERRGVTGDRLVFAPRTSLEAHLARHRRADLFLDTFPYNAHTTASDALWAGLPVLTRPGETFASRVAGSLLSAAGLPELITASLADYEALALRLATTPALLAGMREKLARHRLTAPLFDTDRTRRHIEAAYVTMYQRSQRGEPPASFDVPA